MTPTLRDDTVSPHIPAIAVPLLSLAAFGSGASLRMTDPMLPLLAAQFGVSLGDASLVITVFSIAYGVAQLFFGPIGDRYGKYFVVACATLACAASAICCAVSGSFDLLLGSRLLFGITAAAILPLSLAWIGDVVPYQQRQTVLARFLIGQILGLSFGVLAGGFAADLGNWRLPFYLVALIFACVSVALFLLNRRLPAHARETHRVHGSAWRRSFSEFREILGLPWARLLLLLVFLEGGSLYSAFSFIPSHVYRTFGLPLTFAGGLIMIYGSGGFLFAVASGALVRRLGETGLALFGGLSVAVSLLVIGLAPAWWWLVPACLFAGLGFYMLHSTMQTHATQMAPERRGAAVSAFSASYFMGQSTGVGLAGLAVGQAGTAAIIVIGAIGIILVAGGFYRALRRRTALQS